MSTGSWFKAHRKQVITHTSILVVFVLFISFVSGPLFARLDTIQSESRLHDFPLPAETGRIRYYFDEFASDGITTVGVRGWAFIEGMDSVNSETYIVLKSGSRTYIFDVMERTRQGLTQHFKELNLNLDHAGFRALIPARKIASGEYTVGIYITTGDSEALQYTHKTIIKSEGFIRILSED